MKKILFFGAIISILFIQCGKSNDPFLIKTGAIGDLTKKTMMQQVDSIFSNDSIVKLSSVMDALGTQGEVEIYDKDGAKLMLLTPKNERDPKSFISNIHVFDSRFITEKGLSSKSTFKDLKDNYTIQNVETTITSVVVFLADSEIFVTIDKKELPEDLRYDPSLKIDASQIPDDATFKYFMLGWDPED